MFRAVCGWLDSGRGFLFTLNLKLSQNPSCYCLNAVFHECNGVESSLGSQVTFEQRTKINMKGKLK